MICLDIEDDQTSYRPREALRRVLVLIDQLSHSRYGLPTGTIRQRVIDATGIEVCAKTIKRDLQLLESLNLVEKIPSSALWRLLNRAQNIQSIASEVA